MRLITNEEFTEYEHLWKNSDKLRNIARLIILAILVAAIVFFAPMVKESDATVRQMGLILLVFACCILLPLFLITLKPSKEKRCIATKEIYVQYFEVVSKSVDRDRRRGEQDIVTYILQVKPEDSNEIWQFDINQFEYRKVAEGMRGVAFYFGQPKFKRTFRDRVREKPELRAELERQGIDLKLDEEDTQAVKYCRPNYYKFEYEDSVGG